MIGLILVYIGLFVPGVVSQTDFGMHLPMYYTNSCNDNGGRALTCKDGHVIRINDVRCMPYNRTCDEKDKNKIVRLCDGLQTCSYVDLRRQLYLYCKDPGKQVVTSFHCIPEDSKPICRSNVCGEDSRDVRCRRGKVFHLLTAKCLNGEADCAADVYMTIYTVCEGHQACLISDIKKSLHPGYCEGTYVQQSNIFMDFICLDENVISETCTGSFQTLIPKFGVLRSPDFPHNPNGLQIGCYWAIYPDTRAGEQVDITVHLSYSKEGKKECDSKFLTVQYKSCGEGMQQMTTLCEEGRVNAVIHSCGTVFVMHQSYLAGRNRGNRFLVSYAVQTQGSRIEAYENYAHKCEKRYQAWPSTMATLTSNVVLPTDYNKSAITRTKVSEEPLNDSSIPQSEVAPTKTKEDDTPPVNDPWKLVTLLRVVVVNIFLGLLIIALIMALIFVCYRYRTYDREKKRKAACKSETATTLDEKNSTEMHLLPSDDDQTLHSSYQINENNHGGAGGTEREPLQEMTSFTVVSPYETTIFHYNRDAHDPSDETLMYDTETGLSSFFPNLQSIADSSKNQNSESAYSSLDGGDDGIPCAEYIEISDNYPKTDCSKLSQLSKVSNQLYLTRKHITDTADCNTHNEAGLRHFEINNDEYAVVKRSPEHRIAPPQPPKRVLNVDTAPKGGNCCVTNECPPPHPELSHIHPVPVHDHGDGATPSTMHVIPEHDCLLHKIPPPPPPAKMPPEVVLKGNWVERKFPEYNTGSPDRGRQKQSPIHRTLQEDHRL